jgi:hypothetical protein
MRSRAVGSVVVCTGNSLREIVDPMRLRRGGLGPRGELWRLLASGTGLEACGIGTRFPYNSSDGNRGARETYPHGWRRTLSFAGGVDGS